MNFSFHRDVANTLSRCSFILPDRAIIQVNSVLKIGLPGRLGVGRRFICRDYTKIIEEISWVLRGA